MLAVEPGVVVAYERNVDTNTKLRKAGIASSVLIGPMIPGVNDSPEQARALAASLRHEYRRKG